MPTSPASVEVNKTVFRSFGPDMSEEDEEEEAESWEETTGAFPSTSLKVDDHVFSDEPFEGSYYSLEVVKEGSKEETMTGAPPLPLPEEYMCVSVASSDTPAVDNTAEALKSKQQQQNQQPQKQPFSIQHNPSMNSGNGFYPYNIYQSLAKGKEREDAGNDKPNAGPMSSTSKSNSRRTDREESSMPPPATPMTSRSEEETSSVFTDQQSQGGAMEAASTQAPYSVVSMRSRRQGKRYVVRHTLSTNQQVNANPATMLKNLFIGIEQERHMHKLTAQNSLAVHNWLFFLPAILLSLLSGIVVLVFQADLDTNSDTQVYSSIFVGLMALASVFWQAISKQLDLGTRGALHDVTAGALKRLSEDILLTLSSTENVPAEYVALISEKFGQALDSCPSSVPHKLETAFSAVSDRMVLMIKPPMGQAPRKHVQKLDLMRLYATAYDELTTEIIHHWAWPFAFPQPRSASDAALRNFKTIITEGREVSKKKGCIVRLFCPCLGHDAVEKSLFDVIPAASISGDHHFGSPNTNSRSDPYMIRSHMLGTEV